MVLKNMSENVKGMLTELKRFSTHDGPGIRTTVFFKGCPLRCSWCSNPETMAIERELFCFSRLCKGYGGCIDACPRSAVTIQKEVTVDRLKCDLCLSCVSECPNRVFRVVGKEVDLQELVHEVEKDQAFYVKGGGVTLSGGEPLFQPGFALGLLAACRDRGINTVLDTSGFAPRDVAAQAAVMSDLVLLDIKHMDGKAHMKETGVDNGLVLQNAQAMAKSARVRISVVLVEGFNDSRENVRQTAEFGRSIGAVGFDINPLHALGSEKYRALGGNPPYERFKTPEINHVHMLADILRGSGFDVTVGRMM